MNHAHVLEKRGLSLIPIDEDGVDLLSGYPDGKRVVCHIHIPVNEKHWRLYRVLQSKILKSGAWDGDREGLDDYLKIKAGHVRTIVDAETGKAFYSTKSLNIDSLTDPEFREFFENAVRVICEVLLKRNDWAWLKAEIIATVERRNYGVGP